MPWPLYPCGKRPRNPLGRRLGGPQNGTSKGIDKYSKNGNEKGLEERETERNRDRLTDSITDRNWTHSDPDYTD